MREELLRLLLLPGKLETVEAWKTALKEGEEWREEDMEVAGCKEERGGCTSLIAAIDAVVPYLPDYSAVSNKLKALMDTIDPSQADRLVQGWLQCTPSHVGPFRKWVVHNWLQCSHLTSADPEVLLQWRHALFVAVTNETVKSLKWTLLKCLSAVDEVISEQFEARKEGQEDAIGALQPIESVEELLDFYWLHAEQLLTCSLLCAAKLHALAVRSQRSASNLAEDEEVLVRLRCSVLLKPEFFKPLLQHAVAMKTVPGSITASQLWTSDDLAGLVRIVDLPTQEKMLVGMSASRKELESAFEAGVEHIYNSPSQAEGLTATDDAMRKYIGDLSVEKRKLLLAKLERELDDVPPHLFPHILLYFGLVIKVMLSSTKDQKLIVKAVGILFALFDQRSHDASSCMDALALQLSLSVSRHPVWHVNISLYIQMVESLSEITTLHVDPLLKWTSRMALQQLLFECDVQLLHATHSTLRNFLPRSVSQLVTIRMGH